MSLPSSTADIDAEVNDVAGILNTQHARLVSVAIALLANDQLWCGQGMTSAKSWLAWRAGISPASAQAVVTIAERADDLPETLESFRRGELSLDQAAAITRRAPGWCDAQARDYGRVMTVQQLRTVLGSYPYPVLDDDGREVRTPPDQCDDAAQSDDRSSDAASEPASADDAQPTLPDEWCSFTIDDDGVFRLSAGLHPETGNVVQRALDAARDRLFNDGQVDVDTVDALRFIAERSLDAEPDPRRRARFTTSLSIDVRDGEMVDTARWRVPDAVRQYFTCDAMLTPSFVEDGLPVSVGRSTSCHSALVPSSSTAITGAAEYRAAAPGSDSKCTTSSTGNTTGQPTPGTLC